ncbi:hypothetical protein [Methanobrevibacter sp.]|uniref:hypothetical protein n=1 Tax=Methanobrevibacter sp. TaxID=66852 RepID=UPI00386698A6
MKLKNSYILLIAMAIFLLVSIGSVCASENITTDSDDVLADADTDVVLADEDITGQDTNQEKTNTTVTVSGSDRYGYDEDKNITVTVKNNESDDIAINQSELSVLKENTAIGFTYNNSIISITDKLPVGVNNLTIKYLGNANYTGSSTNFLLNIYGNMTLEVPETIVSDGTTVEINLKITDGLIDYVVEANKLTCNLTYIDENGNVKSKVIDAFTIENNTVRFSADVGLLKSNLTINYTEAVEPKTVAILISTRVDATAESRIRDTEDKNITVKVYDGQNNLLNVTKADLKIIDNGKEITDYELNNSVITISSLAIGEHNITINFNKAYYNASSTDITIKVWGNETFAPPATATVDENKDVNITLNLNDGVDPVEIDKEKLNITLFYTQGNQTLNRTLKKDEITVDGQNVIFKVDESFDSAKVAIVYAAENNLTADVTIKVETEIDCDDVIVKGQTETFNFTVTVTASDEFPLNITGDNLKVYNGDKALNATYNNSVITINDKLTYGTYNLTIKFAGNDTYGESSKDIVLKVYGIKVDPASLNINSTKKGEVKLNITDGVDTFDFSKENLNITVSYKKGNDTVTVNVKSWDITNGTLSFELEDANFTTATLTVKYNSTEANVTLNRIYNVNLIPVTVSADYQDGNFTFRIIDIDANAPLADKSVSVSMTQNGNNIYFITKTSSGSYNLGTSTTLTTDKDGIATLENANFYPGLVLSDKIYAPVGVYELTITGSNAVKGTNKTNITINAIDVNIVLGAFSEYYGTDKKVTITVTNAKTGKTVSGVYILLNITGATLSSPRQITDENGTVQLGVSGLPTGTYQMTFDSNDTNLNDKKATGSFTIKKIPVVINGKNVEIYYNSGTSYTIKVTKDGKGVSGVYVFVRLYSTSKKYNDYLFLTNDKGQISFSAALAVGKHKIIVTLADTRYDASQITKTITVKKAPAKLKAKKLKTYYKAGKPFAVKLVNKKTKTAIYAAKVNIKLYVSKTRYYEYNGTTGMDGKIRLSLDNLKPGKYKVVASGADNKNYTAKAITSKIVIKKAPTKLAPKKLTAKKGAKKYFKVTATNKKTKKAISGIKLKVKVYTGKKSKTYTVKTNSKGVAQLSTAKLKVGKHKVVVSSANKYCSAKKAKSSIKIKK